jgi:hypothetical protein
VYPISVSIRSMKILIITMRMKQRPWMTRSGAAVLTANPPRAANPSIGHAAASSMNDPALLRRMS